MHITSTNNEFKVVRILDEYRIIINAGTINGVTSNSYFKITGAIDNVYDPDTQELLGTINGTKASVVPAEIFEKMCICKAKASSDIPLGEFSTSLLVLNRILQRSYPLPIDKSQISNPETYSPIKLGDKAILYHEVKSTSYPDIEDITKASPEKQPD